MCQRREYIPPFEWPPVLAGMFLTPFLLLVLLSGCVNQNPITIERPNARTELEQRSYNVLLVSERIITTAEASNAAGTLPEFMRPLINGLIDAHNLGKRAADAYLLVIGDGTEGEKALELIDLLDDLDAAITKMFQRGGTP